MCLNFIFFNYPCKFTLNAGQYRAEESSCQFRQQEILYKKCTKSQLHRLQKRKTEKKKEEENLDHNNLGQLYHLDHLDQIYNYHPHPHIFLAGYFTSVAV